MTKERLKEIRKLLGWTQQQLAVELKLSDTYICMMELGQRPVSPGINGQINGIISAHVKKLTDIAK